MSKLSKIRWKSGEKDFLKREINNFNRRRRTAIKKNMELVDIVPTYSYREIINNIKTRQDYNRVLKELNWSRAKNAFQLTKVDNAKVTKWELRKTKSRLRYINYQREQERIKANVSTEKGNMGSIANAGLLPKKMPNIENQTAWRKFVESTDKLAWDNYFVNKDTIYSENYLTAWKNVFGNYRISEIQKILSALSYKDIGDAIFENALLDINFIYGQDDIELEEKADSIIEAWKYYKNNIKY